MRQGFFSERDIGGYYNIVIQVHFYATVCGIQGVHKGSVWIEAVLRKFVES